MSSENGTTPWDTAIDNDPMFCSMPDRLLETFIPSEDERILWYIEKLAKKFNITQEDFISRAYKAKFGAQETKPSRENPYAEAKKALLNEIGEEAFKEKVTDYFTKFKAKGKSATLISNPNKIPYRSNAKNRVPNFVIEGWKNGETTVDLLKKLKFSSR